jgi:hypothetical protein
MPPKCVAGVVATVFVVWLFTGCAASTSSSSSTNSSSLTIVTANLPSGTADVAYSFALSAQGGVAPYAWQVASGTLPTGLQLGSTTGIISGTPTQSGQHAVSIEVKDSGHQSHSQMLTISIANATTTPLSVTSGSAPSGTVGNAYTFTLTATGGTAPYNWATASGTLPAGLQLNATSGTISGTPTAVGSQTVGITVRDAAQNSATTTLTISIAASSSKPLSISTTAIPAATLGAGYSFTLTAQGGVAPYTWSITSGSLPTGLLLDSSTGTITGTPGQAADPMIDFQVHDSGQANASQSFTVTVNSSTSPYTTYYVDSLAGSDSNEGTSSTAPWSTVAKVNSTSFVAGDHILFKRGNTWRELLSPSSSGEAGNPIVIDAYGSGAAPIISGADLLPQSAWTLCSGCQSNVWRASVSTQPNLVIFNGVQGNRKTSIAVLASAGDWHWDSGVLYVWCSMNPGS